MNPLLTFLSHHPGKFFGMLKYQFQRFACWLCTSDNGATFAATACGLVVMAGTIMVAAQ